MNSYKGSNLPYGRQGQKEKLCFLLLCTYKPLWQVVFFAARQQKVFTICKKIIF
jgi:hypothetical protein